MKFKFSLRIAIILLIGISSSYAQVTVCDNMVYQEGIRSIVLSQADWQIGDPHIELNSGQSLLLQFDQLSSDATNFTYIIKHCTSDWEESDIPETDYLEGYLENEIREYSFSRNTLIDYVHYSLEIPNNDIQLTASGNYIIHVYEDYNHEAPVFSKRFFVVDPRVKITGRAFRTHNVSLMETSHEIDFEFTYQNIDIQDPVRNFRAVIAQNNLFEHSINNLKPSFIENKRLVYNYELENTMPAGNEYIYFNTQRLDYTSYHINEIKLEKDAYHIYMSDDFNRSKSYYDFREEQNGKFKINNIKTEYPDTEADYVMVHFGLKVPPNPEGWDIYIYGALSNWSILEEFKMEYDFEAEKYQKIIALKQGYYNYTYALVKEGSSKPDLIYFNGSFYETENNYYVYVYYTGFSTRHEQLLGVARINSINQSE